jgi:hypothetical protein
MTISTTVQQQIVIAVIAMDLVHVKYMIAEKKVLVLFVMSATTQIHLAISLQIIIKTTLVLINAQILAKNVMARVIARFKMMEMTILVTALRLETVMKVIVMEQGLAIY